MQRVIVTISDASNRVERDLELSAALPCAQLAAAIARVLGWEQAGSRATVAYAIEVPALGRALEPTESLAEAEVWDGARLILRPVAAVSHAAFEPAAVRPGPVTGWRPLGLDLPAEETSGDSTSTGFRWKRVDRS